MIRFLIASIVVIASTNAYSSIDPCDDPRTETENNWILTLNTEDLSSKQDVLETLRLLGTRGFLPTWITSSGDDERVIVFSFDSSKYSDAMDPLEVTRIKHSVLKRLANIEGNELSCNDIGGPGMGVSN
jgi:hypothetical protein